LLRKLDRQSFVFDVNRLCSLPDGFGNLAWIKINNSTVSFLDSFDFLDFRQIRPLFLNALRQIDYIEFSPACPGKLQYSL